MDEELTRVNGFDAELFARASQRLPMAMEVMGFNKLRMGQDTIIESLIGGLDTIGILPTGCHAIDQELLMHDGTIKRVQDVVVGDLLMGPDSMPRRVLRLCRGHDKMVKIIPVKGDPFVVNIGHILSLIQTNMKRVPKYPSQVGGGVVDVSVEEWQTWSKWAKHTHKLFRVAVEFPPPAVPLPLDAYDLGMLLGDGSISGRRSPSIDKPDVEIQDACEKLAAKLGMNIKSTPDKKTKNVCHTITKRDGEYLNKLHSLLKLLGLHGCKAGTKFIPHIYKVASSTDRLSILAGLLDTDGHLDSAGCFDFISKSERLSSDLVFVARSLGFAAHVTPCEKSCQNGFTGRYYRVCVSGDLDRIPTRILRKRAGARGQIKSVLRTGFAAENLPAADYFGFELDGDHRYLMGDFTVTHNTGKSACFQIPTLACGWKTLVISPLISLMRDQVQAANLKGIRAGQINSSNEAMNKQYINDWVRGDLDMLYCAPERLGRQDFLEVMRVRKPDFVVVDEAHTASQWADAFRHSYYLIGKFVNDFQPRCVAAFTATCPPDIEKDVRRVLCMPRAVKVLYYYRRSNLLLKSTDFTSVLDIADRINETDGASIVYCSTVKGTAELSLALQQSVHGEVGLYHGKLDPAARSNMQDMFMSGELKAMVATNAFGMGVDKAMPLWEKVLTPKGWREMGQLRVGDLVIGANGLATRVVAIHERGELPAFEVEFTDGARAVCADDHKWDVMSAKHKFRGRGYSTKALRDIRHDLRDTSGNLKHFIPLVKPVEFVTGTTLPIHPYLLGVLLGDGGLSTLAVRLTSADVWLVDEVRRLLPDDLRITYYGKYDYGLVGSKGRKNSLRVHLDAMGLRGSTAHTKHVPEQYLTASTSDRLALLQGLCDTDGSVAGARNTGTIYVTVSDRLKDDVTYLVRSLGGIVRTARKASAWYLHIALPDGITPFRLPCKADKLHKRNKYHPTRAIRAVTPTGSEVMRCITVDAPDGLYVTRDFVVTHNSNIRMVLHRNIPGNLDSLTQEVGRGGRDGLPCKCLTMLDSESIRTQRFFITCNNPTKDAVVKVFKVLCDNANNSGLLRMTQKEMAQKAFKGQAGDSVSAVLEILKGAGLIRRSKSHELITSVKFMEGADSAEPKFEMIRDALTQGTVKVDKLSSGYLQFDLMDLCEKVQRTEATVRAWLRGLCGSRLLDFVAPFVGSSTEVISTDLSVIDFNRLQRKATLAEHKLKQVITYCGTPDSQKHDYLEEYFHVQHDMLRDGRDDDS